MDQTMLKNSVNQPLAAFLREFDPIFRSMLMFTKKVGNETVESLRGDMDALRGYVMEMGRLLNKYDVLAKRSVAAPHLVKLANQLDALGAHAMADILDEAVFQLIRCAQQTPQQQFTQQQQQKQQQKQLADRFLNVHTEMLNATRMFSNPTTIPTGFKRLFDAIKELGFAANALKELTTTTTAGVIVDELVRLADGLDVEGRHVLADVADRAAGIVDRLKGKTEEELPIKPGHQSSLSTRYCPDHVGVQTLRIGERMYQCPIDGRTYDYEEGYTNYNGQRVPGGSIAAQTPMTSSYALPQRLFDSRQNILNTIN
jgi:hypothetical protein